MINMIHGNCMEIMKQYPDKYFQLACIDPPYGLDDWNNRGTNSEHMNKKHMQLDKIKTWENNAPKKEYFDELFRVSKNQIIWGGNNFLEFLKNTREFIIWDKLIRGMHFSDCEVAWSSGIKNACRIFSYSPNDTERIHPTQKPVALYKWLLSRYAKPGDKILDTHGGSGSICIACHDLGFDLTWMELDADYYKAAVARYQNHAAQATLFDPVELTKETQGDLF